MYAVIKAVSEHTEIGLRPFEQYVNMSRKNQDGPLQCVDIN